RAGCPDGHLTAHAAGAADARGHAEPAHGCGHGHPHPMDRRPDIRVGLRRCGHRRCRIEPDRQCLTQPRSELHHRQFPGRGVRRSRQSVGNHPGCTHSRYRQQVPGAGGRCRPRQNPRPGAADPVHTAKAARHVPVEGTGGRGMRRDPTTAITLAVVLGGAAALAVLNLATGTASAFHVPTYVVELAGKYLCFAMLALAVDLVWGFAGILTLGHAAFFALGGYAMGMYLMRQIGTRGVYGNATLPDFMVFLGWKHLPWYWHGFEWFSFAMLMVVLVPAVLALVFGWLAFRSRVTGVYLSIMTQALTYALLLAFFRNDMGFGGNNGLTDFKDLLGFPVQADTTRVALLLASALLLCAQFLLARFVVRSRFGKVLIAVRDSESRTRFLGYRPESYKLAVWVLSAAMAGIGGALYVPQAGIINPSEFSPGNSIEAVIWVAVGGRGTLAGPILGAVLVNYGKTWFTGALPELWLYALGALFIFVTLLLPNGLMGLFTARVRKPVDEHAPVPPVVREVTG